MDEEEEIIKASIVYMNNEIDATFDDNKNHEDDKVCSFREIEIASKEGAKYALENQWISVKDELPKIGDDGYSDNIFIHGSGGYVGSAYFEDNKFYSWIGDDEIIGIDYWMPIPELNFGDK